MGRKVNSTWDFKWFQLVAISIEKKREIERKEGGRGGREGR
jgi:hypothetical protein